MPTIPYSKIPGYKQLYYDYLAGNPRLTRFYNGHHRNREDIVRIAEKVVHHDYNRARLSAVLQETNRRFGLTPAQEANLELLKHAETITVITGQQTGLFTGPLYTIMKAFTTLKVASHLGAMLKTPVVPLFWMESSDHDLAEVNHIYFPGAQKAEKFTYGISENPHQQSVGSMILGEDFADYIRQVQRTLPQNDFYDAVTRLMSECYYPGTTYGEAFGKMMSRLFGRWGLIFVDSESVDLKRLATPIIVRKIAEKGRVNELLQEQSAELESENYGRQIQIRAHLLNVYIMRDNIRIPLTLLGEMLTNGDERVVLNDEALMKLAQEHPEFFSPKVALRPIIQDFLFPTVAYIGGPSELAYFAQLKKIYEFFDIQMPIIWPRASATLVGGKVKYHIQRLDIKLEDVFRDPDELFKNLVNHTDYQSPEKTFEAAEISLQQLIDWLNDNLSKIDSTLPHQFSVSYKKMQYQLQSMKSKTFNQLKVKYQSMVNSLKKIQIELYPNQKMQERVYNILYFLSLYGFWIMEYMMDNLDIDTDDHQFLEMSSAEE